MDEHEASRELAALARAVIEYADAVDAEAGLRELNEKLKRTLRLAEKAVAKAHS